MSSQPWVLPDELRMLAETGDATMVREVISVFQRDTESRIGRIREALAHGDTAKLRSEAHAVKGSAGQVGAMELREICQQLEAKSGKAGSGELGPLVERLESVFAAVRADMARFTG